MARKKAVIISAICFLLLVTTFSSAYICLDSDDNEGVTNFKFKINTLAIEEEMENGITPEAFKIKYKYFIPCK